MASLDFRGVLVTAALLFPVGIAVACSSSDDANVEKVGNGVNDIKAACDIRATWDTTKPNCLLCESAVVAAHCECESLKAFSGECLEQGDRRKAACPDTVDNCVGACARTDCACIDKCYDGNDACRQATAARDGCAAEACTAKFCK